MKPKKLLALFTLLSSLILSACGGESTSSNKWDGSCGKCGYSRDKSSEVTKQVNLTNKDFIKIEDSVFFQIKGTCQGYQNGELKFAFGLYNVITEKFVYGSETPTNVDYKVIANIRTVKNEKGLNLFTVLFNISEINSIPSGSYWIYAGYNNDNYQHISIKDTNFRGFCYRYEYYYRDDESAPESIAINQLPPFNITEASVVSNPINHTGLYLKLGGRQPENYTLDQLNNIGTMCDFQRINPSYQIIDSLSHFFEANNNESYIYLSLAGMQAGETYMTHLSVRIDPGQTSAGKCIPLVEIHKEDHNYQFPEENLKFELVRTIPQTSSPGPNEFYGALGIIVSYCD